jgi:predicted nucleic acid-binding protein
MAAGPGDEATIFIDANIFLTTILGTGRQAAASARFLEDADSGIFPTATSVVVLNEVIHRLIIGSIVNSSGVAPESAVHQLKLHPELIRDAGEVFEILDDIRSIHSMKIFGISPATFDRSLGVMREWGLLGNDALHVACMEEYAISTIATYDRDFSRVTGIKIRKPAEVD